MPTISEPHRARRAVRILGALAFAALAAWNGWRIWDDQRPLVELPTIQSWIDRGEPTRAVGPLRDRLRRSPHDGASRIQLARALAAQGDHFGCASELRQVPVWWPDKPQALRNEGQAWLLANRGRDAEAVLRSYITIDPAHPEVRSDARLVRSELINLLAGQDRWDEVRALIWEEYPDADPENQRALRILSLRTRLERSSPAAAIDQVRAFAEADPEDWTARRVWAKFAQHLGRAEDAEQAIQECLKARPRDPKVWRDYIEILVTRGDFEALEQGLAAVPPEADDVGEIWHQRGVVLQRRGKIAEAASAFRRSLELRPYDFDVHYRLFLIEQILGRPEESQRLRKRYEALKQAETDLSDTLTSYVEKADQRIPDSELGAEIERFARICAVLGFAEDARAWEALKSRTKR